MRLSLLASVFALSACSAGEVPPKPLTAEQSAALSPADARLASLYAGSCKSCHTVKDSQAPLTGDRTLWDARWAKGADALLTSALQGKGKMPAGGQCFECSPADLTKLIMFMAGRAP
jgi:cytochrome c5